MGRREFYLDPIEGQWIFDRWYLDKRTQISSKIEALMIARPLEEPKTSLEEQHALREVLVGALDDLEAIDVWIINALLFEKMSLRTAGWVLGIPKTSLARRRDRILQDIKAKIENEQLIKDYLDD